LSKVVNKVVACLTLVWFKEIPPEFRGFHSLETFIKLVQF
jgi:hypothetical protein